MSSLENILTFCVNLSREMILSGANLERVHTSIEIICRAYGLKDVSIFLLSTHISLSAYDKEGNYAARQASIKSAGINLERLKNLNQLSYKISDITPSPRLLEKMLERSLETRDYPGWIILTARIVAMSCLCFMFGGGVIDLIPVGIVTALIHFMLLILENTGLDKIVINSLTMFIATIAAIFFVYLGVGKDLAAVIITISMLVIPGIPLVNAARNLLCGRENNGILQIFKIFIETMALGTGIYVALSILKDYVTITGFSEPLATPYLLIILSFIASMSFGVVFRIAPKDLYLAGLGGALTRISLLLLAPANFSRLLYMTISASVAALYAEFWAVKRRQPSTYFTYPSIIPLIPGDLFFYSLTGFFFGDFQRVTSYGTNCLLSLLGLSIGFVLSSTVSHYVRRIRFACAM